MSLRNVHTNILANIPTRLLLSHEVLDTTNLTIEGIWAYGFGKRDGALRVSIHGKLNEAPLTPDRSEMMTREHKVRSKRDKPVVGSDRLRWETLVMRWGGSSGVETRDCNGG